jgi:hypothetical protein
MDREHLTVEGKGFSELLIADNPKATENRHVRISTQP